MTIYLYTYGTPNGRKISIMLEEIGIAYNTHKIDIAKGEQFSEEFLALNPNGKIPAIVDRETGISVFESGAILIYLAEKTGKLLPTEPSARFDVLQWLMWQMGGFGPMFGQLSHFVRSAPEKLPYPIDRYKKEVQRLTAVLEKQLTNREFICGDYSIADIAIFPWVKGYEFLKGSEVLAGFALDEYPNVLRWSQMLEQRPAVQRGMAVPE